MGLVNDPVAADEFEHRFAGLQAEQGDGAVELGRDVSGVLLHPGGGKHGEMSEDEALDGRGGRAGRAARGLALRRARGGGGGVAVAEEELGQGLALVGCGWGEQLINVGNDLVEAEGITGERV